MKMSNQKNIGGLEEMDQTIPKQFILEMNSKENFTRGGWSLEFYFQFIKTLMPRVLREPGLSPGRLEVSAFLGETLSLSPGGTLCPRVGFCVPTWDSLSVAGGILCL